MSYRRKSLTFFNPWSRNESLVFTKELALRFSAQSGPFAGPLKRFIDEGDYLGLVNFSISYESHDIHHLVNARRCLALFSKNVSVPTGVDLEGVAWNSFAKAELACRSTNTRFQDYQSGVSDSGAEPLILMVQRKIADILGPCPSLDELQMGFGPGASTTCRIKTSARHKLSTPPICSFEAYKASKSLRELFPCYDALHNETLVGTGELSFVPKSAKTLRSIIVEPLLNTLVQKGIGSHMKKRLVEFGCNLYDQSINRDRARLGSLNGSLGTIDLSSASDMIAWKVVETLLPVEWFELLSTWRTGRVVYKKKNLMFELEKFSSMGNGFTFELESLIFYAIANSVCRMSDMSPNVSVFGDDIIVPTEVYEDTIAALHFFGFEVNTLKSFGVGSFRESCGGDYVFGSDIRPFYCKDKWSDARVVGCYNQILMSEYDDPAIREFLLARLPAVHKTYGPPGYGDGHLIDVSFQGTPHNRDIGWSGFVFRTRNKVPKRDRAAEILGDAVLPLYLLYAKGADSDSNVRATDLLRGEDKARILSLRHTARNMSKLSSRDADPYVLRGGENEKIVRIYTLA
jgi:hypothetical protein